MYGLCTAYVWLMYGLTTALIRLSSIANFFKIYINYHCLTTNFFNNLTENRKQTMKIW
jgi:hypothetical protein